MAELAGLVAIVTGGGRGLGRAIVEAYVREGASVALTAARERAEIEAVADALGAQAVLPLLADVADPLACERVVAATLQRFGRLDVLVNNAGRGMKYVSDRFMESPTHFWEVAPETWRLVVETNLNGPFFMTRAAVPALRQQGGSVINISMNYGTMKRQGFSPYGPSKAALESASAIWAQDLADIGVRLNELLPGGATATGMIPAGASAELRAHLLDPQIIGAPAIFLASARSRHLNGRRLVATEWTPERPNGTPIIDGIGGSDG